MRSALATVASDRGARRGARRGRPSITSRQPRHLFCGVVVAEKAVKKQRGHPGFDITPALEEMTRIIFEAAPTLSRRDRRAIAAKLVDDGLVKGGGTRESKIRRLVSYFRL